MANAAEIFDTNSKNLSTLYMIKELGGDLDAAIAQTEAAMDRKVVDSVKQGIEEWKKKRISGGEGND
ncbi:MAG: hypothetical protein FWG83_00205 [Oscillospiraceae bacterium]|nr:hypothetical protein [Oscillospiraceae bacterium]